VRQRVNTNFGCWANCRLVTKIGVVRGRSVRTADLSIGGPRCESQVAQVCGPDDAHAKLSHLIRVLHGVTSKHCKIM
jgi:hypothetical protein